MGGNSSLRSSAPRSTGLVKIGLGASGTIIGLTAGPSVNEIFVFLALSFAAQNAIIAYRTVWAATSRPAPAEPVEP